MNVVYIYIVILLNIIHFFSAIGKKYIILLRKSVGKFISTSKGIMLADNQNGSLHSRISKGIATIEFGHPKANSLTSALLEGLMQEFNSLSENDKVSLILLKSKGEGAFCAGASFDELLQIDNLTDATHFFNGFANVFLAMRNCKKPIVGQIQGKATGGGVGLIAACDYTLATENAWIRLPELAIGIAPFVIAPVLIRKIGTTALNEMYMTPNLWKESHWAQRYNLYTQVLKNIKELNEQTAHFTENLAKINSNVLAEMKQITWKNTENWSEELHKNATLSAKFLLSEETKSILMNFKNSKK